MFRLLFFFCCIYFTNFFSEIYSQISFKNMGERTTKAQLMCNKYTFRACNGSLRGSSPIDTIQSKQKKEEKNLFELKCGDGKVPQWRYYPYTPTHPWAYRNFAFGGKRSAPKEFPHMALVGYGVHSKVKWLCGASLISEQYVLSAAHCAHSNRGPATYIRLGELDLESVTDDADAKDFPITQSFVHPEYNAPILYNDIALFKFEGLTSFNDYIRPTCLNINQNFYMQKLISGGWGATGYGEASSPQLIDVELDPQDPDRCDEIFRGDRLPTGFNNQTMICAGYAPGGRDTCQGDSGGPLQYLDKNAGCDLTYVQVGVISFGEGCGLPDTPAIYTRVSYFIPWIESIVWA